MVATKKALVLIAEIIDGRPDEEQSLFYEKLSEYLENISLKRQREGTLLTSYALVSPAEFQAVYQEGVDVVADIVDILTFVYPVKIRFSLSSGELTSDLLQGSTLAVDSPGYKEARQLLAAGKKISYSNMQYAQSDDENDVLNSSLRLAFSVMDGWKYNTLYILSSLIKKQAICDIASNLGISIRGVYKIMKTNHIPEWLCYLKSLRDSLSDELG
jgi:hypothetical protein